MDCSTATVLAYTSLIILGLALTLLVRNNVVLELRFKALKTSTGLYDSMPTYDDMLVELKYYHLWTYNQWVNWVEKQK